MARTRICDEAELPDGEGRGFTVGELALLLVRRGAEVFAYVNSCPHAGVSLDWVENRFMSRDKRHLQCATHGALFRIEDGMCIHGPCLGAALDAVAIVREAGVVWLAD